MTQIAKVSLQCQPIFLHAEHSFVYPKYVAYFLDQELH